ncbi:hypothetical protein O181_043615 [Austropuccinia psidii MF-1]|uniref:Uncharacterized protein n=1 Tax=Austropuccinia psidii MF-1 TaxID=1389203 RepID=A0A9Q3DMX6_9BASI|nr:hypothetical protein [Austropuccinia psidii MF-1]
MNYYLQVKKLLSSENTEELMKDWTPMFCKGKVQKIKAWFKNQRILSEEQKKELAQKKENFPVTAPQASTNKNVPQKVPKNNKKAPKRNQKGKQKEKSKWNKLSPQTYRIPIKEKTSMDNVFNMARTFMELKTRRKKE